ncbi:hypothetical protein SAMN05444008_111153 [Cnuella takakiae]|uniref:Uncharacterized protein n=1 Tax=Cnuella takakiae TaxID=1302690 RepID=A0A1M5E0B7_9BACT|nr:hypothetical protein [Cnuella takakiae]OLY93815.1 hypothetical protein BUE76_19460 [Cnuella takakiae]SHF72630.1 hypothetical protein SAMN05444008_111153 [Cnuella takakiae]
MLTLLYAAVLVLLMFAPILLIGLYDYRQNLKARRRLSAYFDSSVADNGLNLSSKECLHRSIVGVDAQQRKLLLAFRADDGKHYSRIVSLDNISWCSYHQDMWQVQTAAMMPVKRTPRVDRVYLRLESALWPVIEVEFFNRSLQRRSQLGPLQLKAKQWEALVLQLKTADMPASPLSANTNGGQWLLALACSSEVVWDTMTGLVMVA